MISNLTKATFFTKIPKPHIIGADNLFVYMSNGSTLMWKDYNKWTDEQNQLEYEQIMIERNEQAWLY